MIPPNDSLGNNARSGRSGGSRSAPALPSFRAKVGPTPMPAYPAIPKSGMVPAWPWTPAGLPATGSGIKVPR